MEYTDRERLIIAQALMNVVGDMTSTEDPDNLRGRVARAYIERYYDDEDAGKSFDMRLNGQKVGTLSLTVSKPTDSKEEINFEVIDPDALESWDSFEDMAVRYAKTHMRDVAEWYFHDMGEVPEGCYFQSVLVPGTHGGEVTRTTLRVDQHEVARALGSELPEAVKLMLEGGEDA